MTKLRHATAMPRDYNCTPSFNDQPLGGLRWYWLALRWLEQLLFEVFRPNLSMFVRNFLYLNWTGNGSANFDEIWQTSDRPSLMRPSMSGRIQGTYRSASTQRDKSLWPVMNLT